MSRVVRKNKFWLIPVCVVIVGAASLYGLQQIHAQGGGPAPMAMSAAQPGMPGAPAAAPALASPMIDPTMSLSAVMQNAKSSKTRNWDGTVTEFLKFKYKTLDNRVLLVLLPATYRSEKMTRAGWDTLFQVFDMGYEYQLEAIEKARVPDISAFRNQLMQEISGAVPEGTYSNPNAAQGALDAAKMMLPSLWGGTVELPPLLPGM